MNTDPHSQAPLDNQNSNPGAQPPEETAGMPSVLQSLKFTLLEIGIVRGIRTWLKVNKKDGFDCQSCARPAP